MVATPRVGMVAIPRMHAVTSFFCLLYANVTPLAKTGKRTFSTYRRIVLFLRIKYNVIFLIRGLSSSELRLAMFIFKIKSSLYSPCCAEACKEWR